MLGTGLRNRWLIGAALLLLLLSVALASCAVVAGGGSQPTPHASIAARTATPLVIPKVTAIGDSILSSADVYFNASIDVYSALQLVANLGLQPVDHCTGYTSSDARWRSQDYNFRWLAPIAQPVGTPPAAQPLHGLEVAPTPLTPGDWLQRLAALPSVKSIFAGPSGCPFIGVDIPPIPGQLYFLGEKAWTEDVRVEFAASGASGYGQALATISGLGFRLADPCYEQSLPPPAWRPMGQQASFASGGALVVAITAANSTQWLAQLKAAPGVASVQAPYTQQCAAS
ncbi:MAG: hypothetical protein ACRDID_19840 [Ktedonobacterales bacterium]